MLCGFAKRFFAKKVNFLVLSTASTHFACTDAGIKGECGIGSEGGEEIHQVRHRS
jgi:hypothetical protein